MLNKELGFALIIEEMIKTFQTNKQCPVVGHNMMYDVIYLYNQFIAPLPSTYAEFVIEWN